MTVVIVGVGGVGSYVVHLLSKVMDPKEILILDNDKVEAKNIPYTVYTKEDIGREKTVILALRYGVKAQTRYINNFQDMKIMEKNHVFKLNSDLFIIAVDDIVTRKLITEHVSNWIDVRAEDRSVQIFTHNSEISSAFLEGSSDDTRRAGCQTAPEKEIHFGNVVAAGKVAEMTQDWLKGKLSAKQVFEMI